MARIRTIKPEFWIDEKVVDLSFPARLLFVGMWNFADDQGFVDYKPRRIKMQIFPADEVDIQSLINELLTAGRVVAHIAPIGPVLRIVNWQHQRVDKPARERFAVEELRPFIDEPPRPPDTSALVKSIVESPREDSSTVRESSSASVATEGKGSGREGKGSGRDLPPSAGAFAPRDDPASTDELIAEWLEHCRKRPPGNVIGQVGKQLKAMLSEGIDITDVRAGLAAWARKGAHPSVLPSIVNELMNSRPVAARASPRGLVEHNGLRLKPETIANLEGRARFEAMDQQLAIEGTAS